MIPFKVIAVDFDGTLCENKYPNIGAPNSKVIEYLKTQRKPGDVRLVLWTCRAGRLLMDAIYWCKERGLEFDAVNENLKEVIEEFGGDTRKVFAHEYIDDRMSSDFILPFLPKMICDWWSFGASNFKTFDDVITRLEKVFGFPFQDWQKEYLKGHSNYMPHTQRCCGKTFTYCLKLLLGDRFYQKPINLSDIKQVRTIIDELRGPCYEHFFLGYLRDLNRTLIRAGFKTNAYEQSCGEPHG